MDHFIAPLVVGSVFALISMAARKTRRTHAGNTEIYRFPPLAGYLMAACALLFVGVLAAQVLHPGPRHEPLPVGFLVCGSLAALGTGAAIYFLRFRVVVGEGVLRYGTFRFRSVLLADIIDLDATPGDKGYLYVYLRDGGRVHFSGMLGDIAGLAATLHGCLPPGAPPCARRLRDRRHRGWYLWILLGSMLAIGAALYLWVHYR